MDRGAVVETEANVESVALVQERDGNGLGRGCAGGDENKQRGEMLA